MLSGGYSDLIGMDHHTFYPQWNWRLVDPILGGTSVCQSLATILHFGPRRPNLPQTYDEPMTKHTSQKDECFQESGGRRPVAKHIDLDRRGVPFRNNT